MAEEQHYSANFKRDYLTYVSIGLFFLIVLLEIWAAVWLPLYMKSQHNWAVSENRLEMIDLFDRIRREYSRLNLATDQGKDEASMIMKILNINAIYLRKYGDQLNLEQIIALNKNYQTFSTFLRIYRRKNRRTKKLDGSLGKPIELQTDSYLTDLQRHLVKDAEKQLKEYSHPAQAVK